MEKKPKSEGPPDEVLLNARKQITRSVLLALAALVVIAFACLAWFVSTKDVTGSLGAVRLLDSKFELASIGAEGSYDDLLPETWRVTGEQWEHASDIGTRTGENRAVLWRLTDESNMNNSTGSKTKGIQPGSRGTLQFYVIPQTSEALKLSFHLELIPMALNEDGSFREAEDDDTLDRLLRGHLLFYQADAQGARAWVDCRTGSFTLDFENCEADTPIPITLCWTWPYLLEHVKDETEVVDWMGTDPGLFFYNGGEAIPSLDLTGSYPVFDQLFNNADDYIGTNTYGLLLRLTARIV